MDLSSASDALNEAILNYEAHIGEFLQTGAEIVQLRDRAAAYSSVQDPAVTSRAQAVVAKANGALASFNGIQQQAITTAQQASQLQSQIKSDPQWQALMTADTSVLGYQTLQALASKAGQISGVVQNLVGIENQIDDHLNNVMPSLRSDVDDLDGYAQGKGFTGLTHSLTSSLTSGVSSAVSNLSSSLGLPKVGTWIGIGLAAAVFGPMIVEGVVGAGARSARRIVYNNPPRRHRRRQYRRRR
jgi:hypothetical protein